MRRNQRSPEAEQYRKLYKTALWKRIRGQQLAAHPLCEWCFKRGIVTPASVCHHNHPEDKKSARTFYRGPYTSLCQPCHDGPAQSYERTGKMPATIGVDGWPVS